MSAPAETERDLSFEPVVNDNPKLLTQAQIAHFNEKGYIVPIDVFGTYQANEIRTYFDMLIEKTMELGGSAYDVHGYHGRCQKLFDMATNWLVMDVMGDLLGPNFLMWGSHAFNKLPGDPKTVPWHQDASYWPLTPSRTITAWLAIDDVDVSNAAMKYITGSHTLGHLPFENRTENVVLNQEVTAAEKYGEVVDIVLKAGQMTVHSDMLIHGSEANVSDRRRCGLTMRYAPTVVRPLREGWGQAIILCRGKDEFGHWGKSIPRPAGDDVTLPPWSFKKSEHKSDEDKK